MNNPPPYVGPPAPMRPPGPMGPPPVGTPPHMASPVTPPPQGPRRKLAHSEKTAHLFSSERSRDKAAARRDIERLGLADQQVHYLRFMAEAMPPLIDAQRETNHLLAILVDRLPR